MPWFFLLFVAMGLSSSAQWIIPYYQNNFNAAGLNPAASGLESKRKFEASMGIRLPNYNLTYNTKQNYIQASYTYRPRKRFKVWHNMGGYIETDAAPSFITYRIFGSYASHIIIKKNNILSLGCFAGLTRIQPVDLYGSNDPVFANFQNPINLWPDAVLGFRYSTPYFHFGTSFRNMVFDRFENLSNKQLGAKSENPAILYNDFSYRISVKKNLQYVVSAVAYLYAVQPPLWDIQAMAFTFQRFGYGIGYRNPGTTYAMFQARLYQKFSMGICYAYHFGGFRSLAPNSLEVFIGLSPHGLVFNPYVQNRIVECPVLYY